MPDRYQQKVYHKITCYIWEFERSIPKSIRKSDHIHRAQDTTKKIKQRIEFDGIHMTKYKSHGKQNKQDEKMYIKLIEGIMVKVV